VAPPGQVPVHSYNVSAFYGYRGEEPGREAPQQGDYTGLGQGLRCMNISVRTGVCVGGGGLAGPTLPNPKTLHERRRQDRGGGGGAGAQSPPGVARHALHEHPPQPLFENPLPATACNTFLPARAPVRLQVCAPPPACWT